MGPSQVDELVARALDAIDVERLVETVRLLIDTPSPTGQERACAEALGARLAASGVPAEVDVFAPERANVVARVGAAGRQAAILLSGHLDTTGYGDDRDRPWLYEHGPGDLPVSSVVDGIVSGLGAYNMKGGLAAAAEALVALRSVADELSSPVGFAAVAGESEKAPVPALAALYAGAAYEGGGIGTRRLIESGQRPDAVVICEPSGLAVVNAQPGYVLLRIIVRGRPGYLPEPRAPTTVSAAAAMVDAIRAWAVEYAERAAVDTGLGVLRPPCTVGAIEGGWPFKPGGPPAAVALYVDLRVPPGLDGDDPIRELTDLAARAAAAAGPFDAETLVFARHLPGALVPFDHPLIEAARAAVRRATGAAGAVPLDGDFPPGDDGKLFAAAGIPYVKLGPGSFAGRDARFGREQVRVSELVAAARAYVALGVGLASLPRGAAATWPPIGP
jgi:acetylornithine deacetylase/succinyl-diaminopimelate desuccinylase-like protein